MCVLLLLLEDLADLTDQSHIIHIRIQQATKNKLWLKLNKKHSYVSCPSLENAKFDNSYTQSIKWKTQH